MSFRKIMLLAVAALILIVIFKNNRDQLVKITHKNQAVDVDKLLTEDTSENPDAVAPTEGAPKVQTPTGSDEGAGYEPENGATQTVDEVRDAVETATDKAADAEHVDEHKPAEVVTDEPIKAEDTTPPTETAPPAETAPEAQ